MNSNTSDSPKAKSTILKEHRHVLGKVVRNPSEISVVTKKCYRVTADYYDTMNKENTFNVIRSNQSHSPSPELEAMLQHENRGLKNNLQKPAVPFNPIEGKDGSYEKGSHITTIAPPSAFETIVTPRAKWNKSFLGSIDASTPCDQSSPQEIIFGNERQETETRNNYEDKGESDVYAYGEEEELVSILKYSLISNTHSSCRPLKGSPPLASGRENPAIPTEEIFRKGLLE